MVTRRDFLAALGSYVGSASYVRSASYMGSASHVGSASYVGSAFRRTYTAAAPPMKYGYAAITWGADIVKAIDDIAAVGFRGIQLRGEAFAQYGDRPKELRDLLERHRLAFAVLSSGNLSIDPAREKDELATHTRHAQFVRDAGGQYLQVIDERPKGRAVVPDDYRRLGRLMTELGKRTGDLGVPLVYHHHMNSTGEKPHEVAAVLEAADKQYVRLLFDVAHYQQGGGDPVAALRTYRDWIEVVHLKDVRPNPNPPGSGRSGASGGPDYQFVELGRGRVDLPGVFAALGDVSFGGWAIVELDRVPDPDRTPKEAAELNRRYLVETMHQTI
jgi:inosose dehydratase